MSSQSNLPTTLIGFTNGETDFRIPLYQRRYNWSESHVETLFNDVRHAFKEGISHYFGTITLVKSVEGDYEVIDGQQRLTTLSLLFMALAEKWKDKLAGDVFRNFCLNPDTGLPRLSFENHWDQMAYHQVMLGRHCSLSQRENSILKNYNKLRERVENLNLEDWTNRNSWEKLQLVKVELPSNMIPERVFRRMNGSKHEMSFKDLVRNFLMINPEADAGDELAVFQACSQTYEWRYSMIAAANNRGRKGSMKEQYEHFQSAYDSIKKELVDSKKEFAKNLADAEGSQGKGKWILRLDRYQKLFKERVSDDVYFWGNRYGALMMRIAVTEQDETAGDGLVKTIVNNLVWWMAARRLDNANNHREPWDRGRYWGKDDDEIWKWETVDRIVNRIGREDGKVSVEEVQEGVKIWLAANEDRKTNNSGRIGLDKDWKEGDFDKAMELLEVSLSDESTR